jgi:hypothetical protein
MQQLIIPSLFALAIIVISYKLYKEHVKRKRAESIKQAKESETRFIIERVVMRDIWHNEAWWLCKNVDTIRCSFDREQYVKYLESK